jgi:SCP-2 sterol transfer family
MRGFANCVTMPTWCVVVVPTGGACAATCRTGATDHAGTGRYGSSFRPVQYLSPEWMEAVSGAIADNTSLRRATAGVRLTVEHVATGGPLGLVRWHITIDDGTVALVEGPAPDPDLRFTTDYATAARIAAGGLGAQRAFVEGRLRVGGDLSLLIHHHKALSMVDDVFSSVRTRTSAP